MEKLREVVWFIKTLSKIDISLGKLCSDSCTQTLVSKVLQDEIIYMVVGWEGSGMSLMFLKWGLCLLFFVRPYSQRDFVLQDIKPIITQETLCCSRSLTSVIRCAWDVCNSLDATQFSSHEVKAGMQEKLGLGDLLLEWILEGDTLSYLSGDFM